MSKLINLELKTCHQPLTEIARYKPHSTFPTFRKLDTKTHGRSRNVTKAIVYFSNNCRNSKSNTAAKAYYSMCVFV